ncbi:MAG: NADH-quinone oxidoreductase subunit NuoN [Rhodobacterales bacterium]|jgi:NADH-quinone oxidoreductase subunit N|nr:NADH-quinone oxidoreductase subunit NuoN [Paracoccaceae bacterium]|tara:strand:+ start:620 stop:2059 length:1440 start_codon:yes stop_codon:yes gene_type:complete
MLVNSLTIIFSELALIIYILASLMFAVYTKKDQLTSKLMWVTASVMIVLGALIILLGSGTSKAFGGAFIDDGFARYAKVVVLWSSAIILIISRDYLTKNNLMKFEYPILIGLAVVGMMMMVSAGDLMSLYMGIELQSLALYVIAAFNRDSIRSTEAGLKYFVLGALSSGLLLYGASLIYGFSGTTNFDGIALALNQGEISLGLLIGLVFLATGLAFKVSAAPFHMWTPDVYEGAPTPVTAFFATAPKVAAMILFTRVAYGAFGEIKSDWQQIVSFLAVASMFLGSIAAIGQKDIKRMMAYSSIGHMGFALVGLASGTEIGVQALLIYMSIYVIMNIGTFAFILSMEKDGNPVTEISALNMYSRVDPLRALALMILMFSLAGIPPMVGFFGKFYVLKAAVDANMAWLAIAGVIASVIGAFYYLRIVYLMYFGEEKDLLDGKMSTSGWVILMVSALLMILGVINLFGIEEIALAAASTLFN